MEHLLKTKLVTPPLRSQLVPRPQLIKLLHDSLQRKLFLVSAPAGFGKTTLVCEWVADSEVPVAWLSLDQGDNDLANFLAYFVAALQTILPDIGNSALALLENSQAPLTELLLTSLLNEISNVSEEFVFVLDDYHLVENSMVDDALAFLVENLPAQMHLMITTREDPQLPLARLRARNQLAELRAVDLRFSLAEATGFLNEIMGLQLSEEEVAALEARTEGWIAGLQLAAISMQGQTDTSSFIQSFTGSHRFVMDFLVEEVLQQQPECVQTFLLQTSVLERLNSSLCDAVIADPGISGQEILEYLVQSNLFVFPLDNERRWYRYHALFADLLRQRLQKNLHSATGQASASIPELHTRASKWFEANDLLIEAFQHAVAAEDFDRAERLMAGGGLPLQYRGAMSKVVNWLESLDEETITARPNLRVAYALTLTLLGKPVKDIENILQNAEAAFDNSPQNETTRDTIGQIAAIRAMLAIPQNQVQTVIHQAHRALEYLHPNNSAVRTNVTWALGYAHQLLGERSAAKDVLKQVLADSLASKNKLISVAATINLGQLHELQNQLFFAKENYEQCLQFAGDPPLPFAGEAYLGLARIAYQENRLEEARQLAQRGKHAALPLENVDTPISVYLLFARLNMAQRDFKSAIEVLKDAKQFAQEKGFPHRLTEVSSLLVKVYLHQGLVEQAQNLIEKQDLPLSTARVYLAQQDAATALTVLDPYCREVTDREFLAELLETMTLKALAHKMLGEDAQAEEALNQALALAEPGQYIRAFLDEGTEFAKLLSTTAVQPDLLSYRETLLDAFGIGDDVSNVPVAKISGNLIEPLSEREIEVLRLIAQGLSNREIGVRLFLALNTVKGHNRKLFRKLNVKSRTEALARARELGLL